MSATTTGDLFSPVRNRGAFSGHWLEHRLHLEPDWTEWRDAAEDALDRLEVLWKAERHRLDSYGNEQGLEHAFIQPVLHALGWKLKYQPHLHGRKPDYALFRSDADLDAALAAGHTADAFWPPVAVVADAKKWNLSLDKPAKVNGQREYPPEQIEWYLNYSRKSFGFLTNGRLWRLVPRELGLHQRRFQTYYEIDLATILSRWADGTGDRFDLTEDFRRFFLLFGPAGFAETADRKSLVRRAVEGSSVYCLGVSEGLKGQAFEALRVCIEGFLAFEKNNLSGTIHLADCRENGFILLCRLLFVMFAEDRQLLPYRVNGLYTDNRSLGRKRDEIAAQLDKSADGTRAFSRTETGLWDDLLKLFDLIDNGHGSYKVPAYNGGLFDPDAHPFLRDYKLADWHLARVIDHLGRADDPDHPDGGLFRVDYSDLALQHLGGIYEGLLERRAVLATGRMVVYARTAKGVTEERYVHEAEPRPDGFRPTPVEYGPGSVYLVMHKDKEKSERKVFGSYYTPDHIVEAIVQRTLGPFCDGITDDIRREVAAAEARGADAPELDALRTDFPNRLLRLRVLDPSMGSGHFLLYACQYLAEEIATNEFTPADDGGGGTLSHWKRRVVENCLYGVDLNPLAVDLAKLALWLETVSRDRPLTFLDHHLRYGNSLVGGRLRDLASLAGETGLTRSAFDAAFRRKLPALLDSLDAIRTGPSDTIKDIKDKGTRFAAYRKAVEPFRQLADVWAADAAGRPVGGADYADAAKVVDKPGKFDPLTTRDWFMAAAKFAADGLHAFHWDLAFPEVFCGDGPPGFDAVVGNPPYEVLSEKESGADPTALKAFATSVPAYAPAVRGKQNLYKLFVCRSLDLLRAGGRFGFIVPMPLLGDDQAAEVRRHMARLGRFAAVEAFPQKDNPKQRVFADAKLSTAVFVYVKDPSGAAEPFVSRVHPGRTIEETSESLKLTTADIPLYDPNNFTIVSCGQEDWDLAVRIMKTGRMVRLRKFAAFFQGEVNETNERKKGTLVKGGGIGRLVTRGASICLYTTREASQGEDLFLDVEAFLAGKGTETKANHYLLRRVGVQESSPQNNFRRVIAALVPNNEFCNHTVNYCTEASSGIDLRFIAALLNSVLADWYFRLGSTNAHVSHYQIGNLPCPHFRESATATETAAGADAVGHLFAGQPELALPSLRPLLVEAPFSPVVRNVVVAAVDRITAAEAARGAISRSDRSALSVAAQPYQDFLDALFFALAGLTDAEVAGLKRRYEDLKMK